MIPDDESHLHNNLGLDSTAHRVLTIEPTIIHPQISAGAWPLKHSISGFDDQSLAVRNIATRLGMHDVSSDLQTSSTID